MWVMLKDNFKVCHKISRHFLITSLADHLQEAFRKGNEKETVAIPVTSEQKGFLVSTDAVGPC